MNVTIIRLHTVPLALVPYCLHMFSWDKTFLSAVGLGVQSSGHAFLVMDPLHDIKLTPLWPDIVFIFTKHPECWPTPTACDASQDIGQ